MASHPRMRSPLLNRRQWIWSRRNLRTHLMEIRKRSRAVMMKLKISQSQLLKSLRRKRMMRRKRLKKMPLNKHSRKLRKTLRSNNKCLQSTRSSWKPKLKKKPK